MNFVLGNYLFDLQPGNYHVEKASSTPDTQPGLLRFSWADEIDCKIVDVVFYSSIVGLDNG